MGVFVRTRRDTRRFKFTSPIKAARDRYCKAVHALVDRVPADLDLGSEEDLRMWLDGDVRELTVEFREAAVELLTLVVKPQLCSETHSPEAKTPLDEVLSCILENEGTGSTLEAIIIADHHNPAAAVIAQHALVSRSI